MSYFYIQNIGTGYVVDVPASNPYASTPIIMYKYYGTSNQHWYLRNNMIVSQLNGMVLDVTPEGRVINYPSHGGTSQLWSFKGDFVRNGNGRYLEVADQNNKASARLTTRELNHGWSQKFRVIPI